ncbi:hypothetical protein HJG60_008110 [Phyllostomus discolor]|uniref:Uncharacterized protein n=1 Tax=Phyllostomus discolor TaxID=89673 RepID=A0A834BND6_9CHIR|nr:hypothetical protein HJG60_008110 [Phyllostomus discolor]
MHGSKADPVAFRGNPSPAPPPPPRLRPLLSQAPAAGCPAPAPRTSDRWLGKEELLQMPQGPQCATHTPRRPRSTTRWDVSPPFWTGPWPQTRLLTLSAPPVPWTNGVVSTRHLHGRCLTELALEPAYLSAGVTPRAPRPRLPQERPTLIVPHGCGVCTPVPPGLGCRRI